MRFHTKFRLHDLEIPLGIFKIPSFAIKLVRKALLIVPNFKSIALDVDEISRRDYFSPFWVQSSILIILRLSILSNECQDMPLPVYLSIKTIIVFSMKYPLRFYQNHVFFKKFNVHIILSYIPKAIFIIHNETKRSCYLTKYYLPTISVECGIYIRSVT